MISVFARAHRIVPFFELNVPKWEETRRASCYNNSIFGRSNAKGGGIG